MLYDELKSMSEKALAEANVNLHNQANNYDRQKSQYIADMAERFYEDEQLTEDERDELEENGMPTFTINRMTAIINTLLFFTTSNPPRWKAIGMSSSQHDIEMAEIHDKVFDYCFGLSNGRALHGFITENALVRGKGYWSIYIDKDADSGNGEVMLGDIDDRYVFVDPSSRDFLYRDAGFIQVAMNKTKSQLKDMFPDKAKEIDDAAGAPIIQYYFDPADGNLVKRGDSENFIANAISPTTGQNEDVLPYYETHRKVKVPMVRVLQKVPVDKEKVKQIQAIVDDQVKQIQQEYELELAEAENKLRKAVDSGEIILQRKDYELDKIRKKYDKMLEDVSSKMFSALKDEKTNVQQFEITKEEFDILIENTNVRKTIMSANEFYRYFEHVCISVGSDLFIGQNLHEWNEYSIIPLHYFFRGNPYSLGAAKFMIGKQQEINKAHQLVIHHANLSSNPQTYVQNGAITDDGDWDTNCTIPGGRLVYNVGFDPPREKPVLPLNNAFFTLVQEAKTDLPFIVGINETSVSGQSDRNDEPFRTTAIRDEQATRGLKKWVNNMLEPTLEHVGFTFMQISQATYDIHKVFQLIDDNTGERNDFEINVPKFDYKTGDIIGKFNDYQTAKFNVKIVAGSTFPVNKEMKEAKLINLKREGVIQPSDVLERIEIEGRSSILEKNSEVSRLSQVIKDYEEQVKKLKGENETLSRQIVQSRIAIEASRGGIETKKDVLETEAQQKLMRDEMQLAIKDFKKELNLVLREVKKEKK